MTKAPLSRSGARGEDIQTRPQRSPPPPLRRYVSTICADLAVKTRFADPQLLARWRDIAGPELALLGAPGRILGGVRNATLEVIASSGAAAARLDFEQEALRRRVNQFLGPDRIARIVIKHAGEPPASRLSLGRFRRGGA